MEEGKRGGSRSDREESEVRGGRNEESSEKDICGNVTGYHSILLSSPISLLFLSSPHPQLFFSPSLT